MSEATFVENKSTMLAHQIAILLAELPWQEEIRMMVFAD